MHFNYHRKDNAIQREGFLRFRGCEDCATHYCPFRGQKTTHFHCNRSGCQFTFKNKVRISLHLYIFFHEIKIAASYTFFCTIILGRYGKTQKFPHER